MSELTNIAELLDELDVKDNRIAELEAELAALREQMDEVRELVPPNRLDTYDLRPRWTERSTP